MTTDDPDIPIIKFVDAFPKATWLWYVFGGKGTKWVPMSVALIEPPPLWHRILTRIVLRSQWEKL